MARAGWDVYAARARTRTSSGCGEADLRRSARVTDPDSIAAAKAELDERGLRGLVNNAGVAISAPIELVPLDELRRQLEINLVGQVAVIQAFMPNVREAKGRIVNVSSIGGRIALPLVGPYAASKFGLEAVSDSLRRELRPWGIHVSVVEPGAVVTPIWDKGRATADELEAAMGERGRKLYGRLADRIRKETEKIPERGVSPDEVAKAIEAALSSRRPKTRYVVGRDAKVRLTGRGADRRPRFRRARRSNAQLEVALRPAAAEADRLLERRAVREPDLLVDQLGSELRSRAGRALTPRVRVGRALVSLELRGRGIERCPDRSRAGDQVARSAVARVVLALDTPTEQRSQVLVEVSEPSPGRLVAGVAGRRRGS